MSRARQAWTRALGPGLGLVVVWGAFALVLGGDFLGLENQRLMLLQTAVIGCAAIGATAIIALGGIDLSVGATIALGTVVGALVLRGTSSTALAALATLGSGLVVGAALGALVVGQLVRLTLLLLAIVLGGYLARQHGFWIGCLAGLAVAAPGYWIAPRVPRLELPPFIVTLGLWGALRGLAKGLGDNQPVYPGELGWIEDLMLTADSGPCAWLPPGVWLCLGLALAAAFVLRRTVLGANLLAIGSNELAARLAGVPVERTKFVVYTLAVGCAGLAALLQLSYLSMGDPTTAQGAELRVIAAAVIGGASLRGGQGSILGTLAGALLMTVVDNGCTRLGLDNWVQEIATGAIILAAVVLDRTRRAAD